MSYGADCTKKALYGVSKEAVTLMLLHGAYPFYGIKDEDRHGCRDLVKEVYWWPLTMLLYCLQHKNINIDADSIGSIDYYMK